MYVPETFVSDVGLKAQGDNGRGYYISGYISTDEVDTNREVVTETAMKAMIEQLKSGAIKLDVEHDTFRGKADVPIGRIVEASLVDHEGRKKIFVKAELNRDHSRFTEVWRSIQNKFIDAFSIAYKVKEAAVEMVNGTQAKVLKTVDLLNVALTGNPVNRGATMTEAFMKSLGSIEEPHMTEPTQPPTPQPNAELTELKGLVETQLKSITESIAALSAELKSVQASHSESHQKVVDQVAELKSLAEAPQLKAHIETQPAPAAKLPASPLSFIR